MASEKSRPVGRIATLFRYPVKSMLGETPDEIALDALGVVGDRIWAARDERRGDFSTGKRVAGLMSCTATSGEADAAPTITLPDGSRFPADADEASAKLSAAVDHPVTLWPVGATPPAPDDVETVADPEADLRATMARLADEPMPDFSNLPPEVFAHWGNPGKRYVDAAPILVLTDRSIAKIADAAPNAQVDVRRFRPSLLIDTSEAGDFPERDWIGGRLRIGEVEIALRMDCPRCVMTTHGFADLPKDPKIMRTLVSEANGDLGVYATVEVPGTIRRGDAVERIG